MKKFGSTALAAILLSSLITACGGGGGGGDTAGNLTQSPPPPPPPAATAEGVYGGTLTGSIGTHFQALVLENGEFWSMYGQDSGSIFTVYGFVQGTGTSNNGTYTVSNAKDFGVDPPLSGTLTATYDSSAKTISGSASSASGSVQFSGGPIVDSLYNYDRAASLSDISGRWDTVSSFGGSVSVDVAANGSVTMAEGACSGSGSITPRPSGKNVFNVSITFGPAPCVLPGQTLKGIAVVYPLSTGQTQLVAAGTNASRTVGVAVFGIR